MSEVLWKLLYKSTTVNTYPDVAIEWISITNTKTGLKMKDITNGICRLLDIYKMISCYTCTASNWFKIPTHLMIGNVCYLFLMKYTCSGLSPIIYIPFDFFSFSIPLSITYLDIKLHIFRAVCGNRLRETKN